METDRTRPVKSLCGAICIAALWLAGTNGRVLAADAAPGQEAAISVTVPGLLADKQHYKDKLVRIRGFVSVQREDHSLFRNEAEADTLYGDARKGLWLRLSEVQHDRYRRFHHSFRVVTGRFRTSACEGHMCAFGGSLDDVTIGAR